MHSWVRLHLGQPFYVEYDYLQEGFVWLLWGLLALGFAAYPAIRRQASAGGLILGLALVFVAFIAIPSNPSIVYGPARQARSGVSAALRNLQTALLAWGEQNAHFPADETQLRLVAEGIKLPGPPYGLTSSPYGRGEERLPYRLVYVPDAAGPHQPQPPGAEPGVVYCAVSPNLKQFWLTATVLDGDVGHRVILLHAEHELVVREGKL